MDTLRSLSDSFTALASQATAKVFHVPSSLGGRTAVSLDGKLLLVSALEAETGETLAVLAPGGEEVETRVAGFDPDLGLAVLELAVPLGKSAWKIAQIAPALGSLVLVAAFPSPEGPEVRLDVVRFSGGEGETAYIQTDGTPFPGFAGAALVDPDGNLVGVQIADRGGNRGWAIPASRVADLVPSIVSGQSSGWAWLGIATVPIAAPVELSEVFGDGREGALLISGVQEASPAAKAGLRVGDILASLGGQALVDGSDLVDALSAAKSGEDLPLVVIRAGTRVELSVVPESRSPADGSRYGRRSYGHASRWMGGGRCGWTPGR